MEAIASTLIVVGGALDGLTYAPRPEFLVALNQSFVAYAAGFNGLVPLLEGGAPSALFVRPPGTDLLIALGSFADGRTALGEATTRLDILQAGGTLDCSGDR